MYRSGFAFICLALASTAAIAQSKPESDASGAHAAATATAQLKDSHGKPVGDVKMRETPEGVLLTIELQSVEPGVKAFHIHDAGRCEEPTFQSAGPHFNPEKEPHGLLAPKGAHAGDLPNIHVPETGTTSVEVLASGVTLSSGERSLLDTNGSALVLHAKADDYASDPAGNAGDRVACGIVTR
jgi:Cu-Zn family superoxide dismutase